MTLDKVKEISEVYRAKLNDKYRYLQANKASETTYETIDRERIAHVLYMIDTIQEFCRDGRTEKAMRWLGFMQGVLWTIGVYNLENLKNHCMPNDQEYKDDAR